MGWVIYSERLKRSCIATEAQFLLAQYVFETLRYRRYEWKCDVLNQVSRRAAERLGFRFEGIFRRWCIKAATATRPGLPCWIQNGRRLSGGCSAGWTKRISMNTVGSAVPLQEIK